MLPSDETDRSIGDGTHPRTTRGFPVSYRLRRTIVDRGHADLGDVYDVAAGLGLRKILLDCLTVEGDLSPDERFELGKTIAEYCQSQSRIPALALIGKPPAVTGLGARVASNRGMKVEIFSDQELGLDWLKSRP